MRVLPTMNTMIATPTPNATAGSPELRRPRPHERAQRRVGETEGGQTSERDRVGAEAQDPVKEFDARLERTRRPTARFSEQTSESEPEGEGGENRSCDDQ